MLKQFKIEMPYYTSVFKYHSKIKSQLIKILSKQEYLYSHTVKETASKSDWDVMPGTPREYWEFLFPMIDEHMNPIYKQVGFDNYQYVNYWTNTYFFNDSLNWHIHRGSNWASIYFVDLPNKKQSTIIKTLDGTIIQPEVEEGMILTIPSNLYHCSPPSDNSMKTIIAFNII